MTMFRKGAHLGKLEYSGGFLMEQSTGEVMGHFQLRDQEQVHLDRF